MKGIKFDNEKAKQLTSDKKIESIEGCPFVCIPLFEHKGLSAVPTVKVDDKVKKGQMIGKANGIFSANVFSSISGTVHLIEEKMDDCGNKGTCITIVNDFKNESVKFNPVKKISPQSIKQAVFDAGIIGLSGSRYPTYLKLDPSKKINTILINGAECESYLTCDDVLMQTYAKEVLEGAKLCARVYGLKEITVAIQKDKTSAIASMKKHAEKIKGIKININVVPTKYPIGFEKYLIESVFKIKLNQLEYPAEKGICVFNVSTCFAVYEAVKKGKPLFERLVTVSGLGIKKPANYIVPCGATFSSILKCADKKFEEQELVNFETLCTNTFRLLDEDKTKILEAKTKFLQADKQSQKGLKTALISLKKECKKNKKNSLRKLKTESLKIREKFVFSIAKVVAGGLMMGTKINNLEMGIGRATGGALFLTAREVDFSRPKECINCGMCSSVCPAGLFPNKIEKFAIVNNFEECKKFNIGGCISCGCCSYICPAKRTILQNINAIKQQQKGGQNGK